MKIRIRSIRIGFSIVILIAMSIAESRSAKKKENQDPIDKSYPVSGLSGSGSQSRF